MADKAPRVVDVDFESVQDADEGILSVKVAPEAVNYIGSRLAKGETTFALFLNEKCLNRLILRMAYAVQRRRVTDRLWTPGTV